LPFKAISIFAEPPHRMHFDKVIRGGYPSGIAARVGGVDEQQFANARRRSAAMEDDIQPHRLLRIVARGYDETVGLHRAIHGGYEAADAAAASFRPGLPSCGKEVNSLARSAERVPNQIATFCI